MRQQPVRQHHLPWPARRDHHPPWPAQRRLRPWRDPPRRRSVHPVQLEAERQPQRRWTVLLRLALAVPALVLASVFGVVQSGTAVAAWFVALVLGRTTEGLRELGAFCLRYATETAAYLLLVTPRYPTLAPRVHAEPVPEPQTADVL